MISNTNQTKLLVISILTFSIVSIAVSSEASDAGANAIIADRSPKWGDSMYLLDAPPTHYDDITTFVPSPFPPSDESRLALQAQETKNVASEGGQIEGSVGDGTIQLTWISAPGNIVGYRIYRRDYGPSQHYALRATVPAEVQSFEDRGLDNALPYYYKVVPVLADGTEAEMTGEVTLCPMRAPIWKYVSPEPVIDASDTGAFGASSVGRPGSYGWGLGFSMSSAGSSAIGQATRTSFYSDCLENPVSGVWIDRGSSASWDCDSISDPEVWGSSIIYSGFDGTTWRIGRITPGAADRGMILDVGPDVWDSVHVRDPYVANGGQINELYYSGFDGLTWRIGHATWSGSAWTKDLHNPVLSPGKPGEWDSAGVSGAYVTVERFYPVLYVMYYTGTDGDTSQIGYATSPDGVHWAKHTANPILPVGASGSWCSAGLGHPTGYDFNGETHLWFEGTDGASTSIGRAVIHRSRIFGRHTAIYGPEWFERTAEHDSVPTIYDALYDLLIKLHGFPSQGADYQVMSYYSRAIGNAWNGNPYTMGIGWYSIADYPSYPRVGSYFPAVFAHESGHNFMYYLWGTLGAIIFGNNHNDYHWMAAPMESYSLEKLADNYSRWALTQEQVAQVVSDANARRNSDIFRVLASEYGWGIWEAFFQACRPGILSTDIYQSADTSAKKNTLMICILSVACQTDLRPRFRQQSQFANEIDDGYYDTIRGVVAAAMAGEKEPPSPPSGLTASLRSGPRVKLTWGASGSSDIDHYNIYFDDGSGSPDYSVPFGATAAPWDVSWTSPILEGNRLYLFAVRAVDHWGNEEKNTNVVLSALVPQSPAPFIRDWLVLGPISNTNTATLTTTDYTVTGEARLDPLPGQVEGTYRWRRAWTPDEFEDYLPSVDADKMDLGRLLGNPSLCAAYAFTHVFAPNNTLGYLRVVHDDDCRIWLNGTSVNSSGYLWGAELVTPVFLRAGWNRLCLKICNYWGGYAFTARLCDAQGGELPGVVWSVDAPGSVPLASVAQTELAFNDARIGEKTSLAVNILNRGTGALVVSGIKVQGESASDFVCSLQEVDLAAGAGGQLAVSFSPTTPGAKSAELVAATNDPNMPMFTVRLSGLGRGNALYVNDDSSSGDVFTTAAGNDQNSGLDPGSPLRRLSTVLDRFALQDGDVIYVDGGLYAESVSVFSTDHQFTIRGAGRDLTIIDGGGVGPCMVLDNVTDIHIEQLALQHGKALEGPWIADKTYGGAILASWTDVSLDDVALKDSSADYGGGGCFDGGNVELRNVLVSGNSASHQGGGLYFGSGPRAGSRHLVTDCNVVGNRANNVGGGMVGYYVEIINSQMERNSAWAGGGAYLEARSVIDDCNIVSNLADYGGGLDLGAGATAKHCRIGSNTANVDGGGVYMWQPPTTVQDCMIVQNSATNSGGGVYCADGATVQGCIVQNSRILNHYGGGICLVRSGTVKNTVISGNFGVWGGGLCCYYGGNVQNCTIIGNAALSYGGGVHCLNGGTVESTIMYSNRAPRGSNYYNDGQGWSYSYCRATPKIPNGLGNIDADPRFADSGYWNPNDTLDALDDDFWVDGDYHLKSQAGRWNPRTETWVIDDVTSPCIDAGDPDAAVGLEPAPNGGRINMGAYGGTIEASKSP